MPKKPQLNRLEDLFNDLNQLVGQTSEVVLGSESQPEPPAITPPPPPEPQKPQEPRRPDRFLAGEPKTTPRRPKSAALPPVEIPLKPEPLIQETAFQPVSPTSTPRPNQPVLAVPFKYNQSEAAILEVLSDEEQRNWSEDDQALIQEVANQLALALENARLYAQVQEELEERVRAEQETLRRNQNLAVLNQIGQQLGRLTEADAIFNYIAESVGQLIDNRYLTISLFDTQNSRVLYPISLENGQKVDQLPASSDNGLPKLLYSLSSPLLLSGEKLQSALEQVNYSSDLPKPLVLLAAPLMIGQNTTGAIFLQNFEDQNAFTPIDVDLLSTVAAQMTNALENANLLEDIKNALSKLENREKYQANVARAAAVLTESGTRSLPEVLSILGEAVQCNRIYFAQIREDKQGLYWQSTVEWNNPLTKKVYNPIGTQYLPVTRFPNLARTLRERSELFGLAQNMPSPEKEFLKNQQVQSVMILSVRGKSSTPNFLAFEQFDSERNWLAEEISVLRVAADAISNTIVREDLMGQLQVSLAETENLYNASHRLAIANSLQEMVTAITLGVQSQDINRSVLILFRKDANDTITGMHIGATWFSGHGTPPPAVGDLEPNSARINTYQTLAPIFYPTITDPRFDPFLFEEYRQQNIQAIAILPLWAGKRQLGVLLLEYQEKHDFTGIETRSFPPLVDQLAIAVENLNLFEQTQEALSETETLYHISNGIAQASGVQDLLALVSSSIMPAQAQKITMIIPQLSPSGEVLGGEWVGYYDKKQEYHRLGATFTNMELPFLKQELENDPFVVVDVLNSELDLVSKGTLQQQEIGSAVFVPLRAAGRLAGILVASTPLIAEFDPDEVRQLQVAGNGIAVALERQRLLKEAQQRAFELQTAAEIARDTTSTLSLSSLLHQITELVYKRYGFYHVAIYLLDEMNEFAIIQEAAGEANQSLKARGNKFKTGSRSVVGNVVQNKIPLIDNDINKNPLFTYEPLLPQTRSEIAVPLKIGDKVTGAIDIHSDRLNAFTSDDITVMQILSDQVAIAIENARAYELSQKAIEDMKEVDRFKSQFLANMSHELRTPLNSIIGFSKVILKGIDGPITDLQQQDLSAIFNSGQHLLSLITDILDLSKIEAGKMQLSFSEVNLNELIRSAMSTAIGLVKDKPIKLEEKILENMPILMADQVRVRQVLINFLSNAAKFTEEGTITVETHLTENSDHIPEVMVTVTDSGPGIAEEDQNKLFQPFSQVDDSPTRKSGGTGLGLSICRSLIEMHKGRIGLLHSEVGKGSTFFFTLPLINPEADQPVEDLAPVVEIPVETKPGPGIQSQPVILAIDDDLQVIGMYERYLKPYGYQVVPLTNSEKAVETAQKLLPHAITLDIMMDGTEQGWQVLQDLKANNETASIPVVICSIIENRQKGSELGAANYLVKPFSQDELIQMINQLAINAREVSTNPS
jgi:signal transduction histidine kinase/CheY-like chemotaxis protein